MSLSLAFGQASAAGPRPENQDALRGVTPAPALAASKGYLFAIADGVSQCADGGLAARASLQAVAMDYYTTPETWPVAQSLDRLLIAQNHWLRANGGGQPLLTTLSAVVLRGNRFTLAHVGDCRVYRWRRQQLQRLSEDHVWNQPGMQHVLKRALGLDQHLVVDYHEGELAEGDCFVLLSDGVWASLKDGEIANALREYAAPQAAADALVAQAQLARSQDNASALVVQVVRVGAAALRDTLAHLQQYPPPPALKPGQVFEGFHIQARLNESQQALLYRAHDSQGQAWLLKTLPVHGRDDAQAQHALLLEEWFLRRVAGRYFPELYPAGPRQYLYYAMREYPGASLAQRLHSEGPLSLPAWLGLAMELLKALGQLHRRNIVHRDIKPQNLWWSGGDHYRLLDFGLAYCPGLSSVPAGEVAGTPNYIAPQAYTGEAPNAGHDLYAAGVTLYLALTGHLPHGEIEAFQRPRFGQPTAPGRYRPDLPGWLEAWLLRAVAPDAALRFETAEHALLALEHADRSPRALRPRPLLEREPVKVWRSVALLSLLVNVVALLAWLKG
ncbi:bifunctional protein-serine/threonine kinase/phosphatase [Pseudomonas typographi]|uniref:bifunctional protein-serine/threonine kinase/phosphatase n=1 Tax=Pseudomonas typographi TaxID=2715964 RepID=UPI001685E729|nr:bifunctional protein-serine/threonine kinase/phosphatase [Pseudomonas typographi]MBD1553391.1 bifunctional protein-serine/threonine kinase/phosphatase [Pseudomonas typographi]